MGFDPALLGWLADAMARSADSLRAIRDDDPAASSAMRRVRGVRSLLEETWLPRIGTIRRSDALCAASGPFTPAHLDGSDARNAALFVMQGYGWHIRTDLAAEVGTAPMSAIEARALGAMLSGAHAADLLDSAAEVAWLTQRISAIAADPALAADFGRNVDVAMLFGVISDAWHELDLDGRDQAPLVELAAACAAAERTAAGMAWISALVDHADPLAAALALAQLGLSGGELGELADRILVRWTNPSQADPGRPWWPDVDGPHTTADVLLPLLAADPSAAASFLSRAADHPEVLFTTTADEDSVSAVLTAGLAAAELDAAEAGAIVRPVLDWLDATTWTSLGRLEPAFDGRAPLAAAIGPWLPWFSTRTSEWGWTRDEADDRLAWLIESDDAVDAMVGSLGGWQQRLADHPLFRPDGSIDGRWLDEVATVLDQLTRHIEAREVDTAASRRWLVDQVLLVGDLLIDAALERTPAGVFTNAIADAASAALARRLTEAGFLPPDTGIAESMAHADRARRTTTIAVIAVVGAVHQLIASGALPATILDGVRLDASADDAHGVRLQLRELIDHVAPLVGPAIANGLTAVLATFLSPSVVGDLEDR